MNIKLKLKIVMFLQYGLWGSWLITLGTYMFDTLHFTGLQIGSVYGTMGIASLVMPSLLGIIGDKWLPSNRLYMLCHLIGGIALFFAAQVTTPKLLTLIMLINCLAYMPTIAISNTVSYFSLEKNNYDIVTEHPKIRVYGTVGFIIAMWAVSFLRLEKSNLQLYIASGLSILLFLISTQLPLIPTAKKLAGKANRTLVNILGLEAFVLFKQPKMATFFLFSILLGAVLQLSNTYANPFISDFASIAEFKDSFTVQYPSVLISISQISEVVFILFVPFFLKRFGIKKVMLIAMLAWVARYALFAYGDPSDSGFILLLLSMIVYGCAFDFYNISGSIFVEKSVDPQIRSSAQGLFMTMTNGLGAYLGSMGSGWIVDYFTNFSVEPPVKDWSNIWLVFAGYSLVMAVLFIIFFNEDGKKI